MDSKHNTISEVFDFCVKELNNVSRETKVELAYDGT